MKRNIFLLISSTDRWVTVRRKIGKNIPCNLCIKFGATFGISPSSFFGPIFGSIPSYSTDPALIVIGLLMTRSARKIDWEDLRVSFPVEVTIVCMPISY